VIGDFVTVARNRHLGIASPSHVVDVARPIASIGEAMTRYHLRFKVADTPGVLATVATIFAKHNVSVANVRQTRPSILNDSSPWAAELHLMTHLAPEADQQACVAELLASSVVGGAPRVLRMEGM
jgi:homoserine dehydrogenase